MQLNSPPKTGIFLTKHHRYQLVRETHGSISFWKLSNLLSLFEIHIYTFRTKLGKAYESKAEDGSIFGEN